MIPRHNNPVLAALNTIKQALPFKVEESGLRSDIVGSGAQLVLTHTKDLSSLQRLQDTSFFQLSNYPELTKKFTAILEADSLEDFMQYVSQISDAYLDDFKNFTPEVGFDDAAFDPILDALRNLQSDILTVVIPRMMQEALLQERSTAENAQREKSLLIAETEPLLNQLDQLMPAHAELERENQRLMKRLEQVLSTKTPEGVPEPHENAAEILHQRDEIKTLKENLAEQASELEDLSLASERQALEIEALGLLKSGLEETVTLSDQAQREIAEKLEHLLLEKADIEAQLSDAQEKIGFLEEDNTEYKARIQAQDNKQDSSESVPSLAEELIPDQVAQLQEALAAAQKKNRVLQKVSDESRKASTEHALYTNIIALERNKSVLKNRLPIFARFRAAIRSFVRALTGWPAKAAYERDLDDINRIESDIRSVGINVSFDKRFDELSTPQLQTHLDMFKAPSLPGVVREKPEAVKADSLEGAKKSPRKKRF